MCPFVEKADPRCATHLTLRNLYRAFAHCADRYSSCPVYQALNAEQFQHDPGERVPDIPVVLAAS